MIPFNLAAVSIKIDPWQKIADEHREKMIEASRRRDPYYFFIDPDGREALIKVSSYSEDWLRRMTGSDLSRVRVY